MKANVEPASEAVRLQVGKILASTAFAKAEKLKRFLRFTVEQTLDNRGDRIKEYSIAVEVFERNSGFDPRLDPIVRVQAGKLRSKLDEFYAAEGQNDSVIIQYPKGGYVPVFKTCEVAEPPPKPSTARAIRMKWAAAALGVVGIAAILAFMAFGILRNQDTPSNGPPPSIAVLPFLDMSPDKDQEFFCDGITDEIINALVKIENLKVVARTSTFEFKTRSQDIREIAAQLKVTAVLEGSVRKSGDRLRVTAQLNDASNGFHLWSGTFDKDMREIFQIQEEIAQAIVDALSIKLALNRPAPLVKAYTEDIETYTLYLKGRHYFNSPNPEGFRLAIAYFEQAIVRDPAYAPAYAGLAEAYYRLARRYDEVPKEAMLKAKRAALKALQIDDSLAEAHSSLAILADYEWDRRGAEKEFKRALELGPSSAWVHHSYALHLRLDVRLDEALREMLRAQALDPLSSTVGQDLTRVYIERREFDHAIEEARRLIARDPSFYEAYNAIGVALGGKGMHKEAVAAIRQAHELNRRDPRPTSSLGYELALTGAKAEAAKLLEELQDMSKQGHYVAPIYPAHIAAGFGNLDTVFYWLEKAYEDHIFQLSTVPNDYRFDVIRSDPRYGAFLRKTGLGK